jgi:peptidoglycan DL-endopeptidase CwlO
MRDVASLRTKRAVRAAVSFAAAMAVVGLVPAQALAVPPAHQQPPTSESEALKQYQELSTQAAAANEQLLAAQVDLQNKQAQLQQATTDLEAAKQMLVQAQADEEAFRDQVDVLTSASFQGARFNKMSALLTGSSPEDFLERASALGLLASDNEEALSKLTGAVNQADQARKKSAQAQASAQEATTAQEQLTNQIAANTADLETKAQAAKDAYNKLSGNDKDSLGGSDNSVYIAPPGAGGTAAGVAMEQRGDPYVWGAAGPDEFDCSGLTQFAYRAVGVDLPHSSRSQYNMGVPVSLGELRAGDLLFYGSSPGSIHHVAMAISNTELVHASTTGTPVKTGSAPDGGGGDFLGAKRLAP